MAFVIGLGLLLFVFVLRMVLYPLPKRTGKPAPNPVGFRQLSWNVLMLIGQVVIYLVRPASGDGFGINFSIGDDGGGDD